MIRDKEEDMAAENSTALTSEDMINISERRNYK